MYGGKGGGDDIVSMVTSATVTGGGVFLLPNTGGNSLATILAYSAVILGVVALISQLIVRIVRRRYR